MKENMIVVMCRAIFSGGGKSIGSSFEEEGTEGIRFVTTGMEAAVELPGFGSQATTRHQWQDL
jgi:hypothetical protein